MIWHIFRKDCRVLRIAIAGAALAHVVAAATWVAIGPFEQTSALSRAAYLLSSLALVFTMLLIVMAVHEDPVFGVTRDWSVRPIRRRDMLLAKIVFALIAAHGPLLVIDFTEALVFGFPVAQAAGAALARGLALFCTFSMPAIVIAAFTRTLTAWIAAALIYIIGTTLLLTTLTTRSATPLATMDVLGWMSTGASTAIVLLASLVVLPLLYTHRSVSAAGVALTSLAAMALVFLIPWQGRFEIQRSLSPRSELADPVQVRFDAGQFRTGIGFRDHVSNINSVLIPLHLSGLATDHLLIIDNAAVRLIDNGTTIFRSEDSRCNRIAGGAITCRDRRPVSASDDTGVAWTTYMLSLPLAVYDRVRDRPVQLEIDFSLTLLGRTGGTVVADSGSQPVDIGTDRCMVRKVQLPGRADAQLRCLHTTLTPACTLISVDAIGDRSLAAHCRSNYAPFRAQKYPDVIDRSEPSLVTFGGDAGVVRDGEVKLETFAPQAYFTRSITIPAIRLGEQLESPLRSAMN